MTDVKNIYDILIPLLFEEISDGVLIKIVKKLLVKKFKIK